MSTLFFTVGSTDSNSHSLFSTKANKDVICLCGSADVEMMDGSIKSPDYSMYEVFPKLCIMAGWPTVVWEVAYSQDEKKLAEVLGRYVTCSAGMVQLAIGINIKLDPALKLPQNLKRVTCTFWEVKDIQRFATLEESGSELNYLTRCDKYASDELDYIVPAASQFSCVSQIKGEYVKFISSPSAVYTVSAFYWEYLSDDDLCFGG
jgi:hypothetical protein